MRSLKEGVGVQSKEGVRILCKHRMLGIFEPLFKFRQNKKLRRQKNGQKCATKDKNGILKK